jgi:predicted alpha/beta-fold hydrolase
VQGNLVRFSPDASHKDVPTAVLVHGILGSKRNLNSFARMLTQVRVLAQQAWRATCVCACRHSTGDSR